MDAKVILLALAALMLAGCTMNPEDSVPVASDAAANFSAPPNATSAPAAAGALTMAEVAVHNTKNDCWMVIDGKVLDLSSYTGHPGGDTYAPYCGTDATEAFYTEGGRGRSHSQAAFAMLGQYTIGELGKPMVTAVN